MARVLAFLCLFSLLSPPSAADPAAIVVSLTPLAKHPSSDLSHRLNHLATASLHRARHLKRHNVSSSAAASAVRTPLFPQSYGGYSISLSFGTPPQTTNFVMDTGSSLVWFPCTSRYACSGCSFPSVDPSKTHPFVPKLSSSSKIVGCKNPNCELLFGPNVQSKCRGCDPNAGNCTQSCPAYVLQYGSGNTAGLLLTDTLNFPEKTVPDFLVGCSVFSTRQPSGIAGFGRGKESLPAQMGVKRFSYCLLSHRFDDAPKSSDLVLETAGDRGGAKTSGLSYTPFRKNPVSDISAYKEYYYLTLRKIILGDKHVKVPYKYLVPGPDGNGGTIVDSGSTFTYMERPVFEAVAEEFEKQMSKYKRAADVENRSGLKPCFDISAEKSVSFPDLTFQFKGGAKMVLPLANYFSLVGSPGVVCVTIVSDDVTSEPARGPAIILGNYQQQNYHIEYDLQNERFGFKKQTCN